ncbi:hypothetical protein BIV02_04515 [Curtobacterium sp. MMLR14_014]|uniref:aldehyde dehydrogenase family protein n=1 Tax=unclassified Curtobacterium TaxID=257496 RepID=UPI0008F92BDE|nr:MULTISPECIES: aldehyde dehydrogenase family protein [unclassified Curtobacterium]OII37705.1 hypothetical protein BIU91_11615 [Curtobacterium sp. MMLR14_002]OII42678.1 hypothetical protein BIV02_04515 [Curtobacterium sp. MMLR14_014]
MTATSTRTPIIEDAPTLLKVNPATGRLEHTFPAGRTQAVHDAVEHATSMSAEWASVGAVRRGDILFRLADLISRNAARFADSIGTEHGKPTADADAEVERTVALIRHAAGFGRRTAGVTLPSDTPHTSSATIKRPVGPAALITPWNFPLAIPAWKLAPALVAGCTVVLKPSPLAPRTAQLLADFAEQAGVPHGVITVVQGDAVTGELLVSSPLIRAVSFTGSVEVGRAIQQAAARTMARTQLEMGGKNAVIVLADADLDRATDAIVSGAFGQSGQRCSATSRVIVDATVHDALVERIVARATSLQPGPPEDARADLGPLITDEALQRCLRAVQSSLDDGGSIACGGHQVRQEGNFMAPTVVIGLEPTASLAQTEVFGPLLVVLKAATLEEAIAINNAVPYGMSAAIFTTDLRAIARFVDQAEAGMLHVNRAGTGAFPHMPHIGAKASQFGPAECSEDGVEFFLETRTVTIDGS